MTLAKPANWLNTVEMLYSQQLYLKKSVTEKCKLSILTLSINVIDGHAWSISFFMLSLIINMTSAVNPWLRVMATNKRANINVGRQPR